MILLAFCRLSIVGLAVSLADNETFADRSSREFVQSHCNEPFIPRSDFNPAASSFVLRFILYKFFGRLNSAVDSFRVNSC